MRNHYVAGVLMIGLLLQGSGCAVHTDDDPVDVDAQALSDFDEGDVDENVATAEQPIAPIVVAVVGGMVGGATSAVTTRVLDYYFPRQ